MNSSTRIIPMLFSGSREYRWTAANKMKKQKTPGAGRIALHLGIAEKQNKSSGKLKEIKSCGQEAHKRLEKSTSCYPIMGQNMGQEVLCRNTKIISKLFEQKAKEKVLKSYDFRTIYGCGGRTRTYDLRVMRAYFMFFYCIFLLYNTLNLCVLW